MLKYNNNLFFLSIVDLFLMDINYIIVKKTFLCYHQILVQTVK